MQTYHKPGAPLTGSQQSAMYYARKRRRVRAQASENHSVLTRYRQHLGMQFTVTLQALPA